MDSSSSPVGKRSGRPVLSWSLIAVLAVVAVVDLALDYWLWAIFTAVVVAVAVLPAAVTRDRSVVPAWEALALTAVPLVARAVDRFAEPVTYVAVAMLALLVVVEITAFTDAEMPSWFAVAFVVMTTMTVAALWAVVQYHADAALGTDFLSDQRELMLDLIGATVVGLAAGVFLDYYFLDADLSSGGQLTGRGETDG